MNTKKLTIPLLLVVGVIWYQVFVRVKSNFETDEIGFSSGIQSEVFNQISKRDSFTLHANYVDPFLKKGFNVSSDLEEEPILPENQIPVYKPLPTPIHWPSIKYHGIIKKDIGKNALILVTIDGYCMKMRQGEAIYDDILIAKTYRDSIQVQMGKNKRMFYKEKN